MHQINIWNFFLYQSRSSAHSMLSISIIGEYKQSTVYLTIDTNQIVPYISNGKWTFLCIKSAYILSKACKGRRLSCQIHIPQKGVNFNDYKKNLKPKSVILPIEVTKNDVIHKKYLFA